MGNSASSSARQHDDTVDYGFLTPQGVYTGPRDWNQQVVGQLIVERRLAPFYRPLDDYEDTWDDDQILAARKELPEQDSATSESGSRIEGAGHTSRSASISSVKTRQSSLKEPSRIPEALVYKGAVECPICFLYYPPNINHSRCCYQAICTECFVQIKRSEPTTTHLESEPAACPYCVQENFGVVYTPPPWRAGIGADNSHLPIHLAPSRAPQSENAHTKDKHRRKSFGADSSEVVTIDHIRPDWEAKLAAVRATAARRANRRIIMRQVGDRLIPVGVTSGRVHPLAGEINLGEQGENTNENEGRNSRRSRRRQHQQQPQDLNQFLGTMGLGGQDLEELMLMEAMRLSLIEHEEQQRKEADKKRKEEAERAAKKGEGSTTGNGSASGEAASSSNVQLPPIPSTSPIEVTRLHNRDLSASSGSSPGSRGSASSHSGRSPAQSVSPNVNAGSSLSTSVPRSHAPSVSSPLSTTTAAGGGSGGSLSVALAEAKAGSHSRSASQSRSGSRAPTPQPTGQGVQFSTLSAALVGHGAASAILAASGDRETAAPSSSSNSAVEASVPTASSATAPKTATTAPPPPPPKEPITIQTSTTAAAAPSGIASVRTSTSAATAPQDSEPTHEASGNSDFSVADRSQSYDQLPSSPESSISHRPLLVETPTVENTELNNPSGAFNADAGPKLSNTERTDSLNSL